MNKIKFSHDYKKLYIRDFVEIDEIGDEEFAFAAIQVREAKLLEVLDVNLENLHPSFITYDTDNGKYELPKKGRYLLLIFSKGEGDIFTTIRRFTMQKAEYYVEKRGEIFEVVIEGDTDA